MSGDMKGPMNIHRSVLIAVALLGSVALGFPGPEWEGPVQEKKAGGNKFDVNDLTERVRNSSAIGIFTKLSLRNQVEDLLEDFRRFHDMGRNDPPLHNLRQRFNLLVMKLISLLQDRDPKLSSDIYQAREVLWSNLADREKFRNMTANSKQSAAWPRAAAIFSLAWAASPPSPPATVSTAEDLAAVIALQGRPCNKVVDHKKLGENDFVAHCATGDVYRVYIDPKGRVQVERQGSSR